jgi:hypothetical protein
MCGTLIGMTEKAAFNAEEWSKLVEAPALAALRVVAADRGGTIRESLSLGRAYAEVREEGGGLLGEIAATPPHVDRSELKDREAIPQRTEQALREALSILERTATPEELEAYRAFVLKLADTVAHAHKEGGFLGIGGKEVSESEQAALDELAAVVGG